jgi:hypothetical protein
MPEDNFQREVLDRLIRIETKQDDMIKTVDRHTGAITQHDKDIVRIDASAKSAHYRIDGIFWGAGIIGGVAGTVVNFIAAVLAKAGSHA